MHDTSKTVLFVFGTRPEAIKLAPLIRLFQTRSSAFQTKICVTAQHRDLLDQVLEFFEIVPDYDLNLMEPAQTLLGLSSRIMSGLEKAIVAEKPALVFVQGDTTTALLGALAAFYSGRRVAHVEAGLRSFDKHSPFPEEMNRVVVARIADLHFAPTDASARNLAREGVEKGVSITGNTVIDALHLGLDLIRERGEDEFRARFPFASSGRPMILVTCHRRESFGAGVERVCRAIRTIAETHPGMEIAFPVHPNPNVQEPARRLLSGVAGVHLLEPLSYPDTLYLLSKCRFVASDSGGLQEEAPALGKPVLVLRENTERMEGVDAGTAKLVGTNETLIVESARELLSDSSTYTRMSRAINPYGDGKSCERILIETERFLSGTKS